MRRIKSLTLAFLMASTLPLAAQTPETFTIGYIELDPAGRIDPMLANYLVPQQHWGSAVTGAEIGIADGAQIGQVIGVEFALKAVAVPDMAAATAQLAAWQAEGIGFVIADLPAADLLTLSDAAGDGATILNIGAGDDHLRGEDCRANLVHILPSVRMETDAVVQYLVARNWRNILLLQGPAPEDAAIATAVAQSAAYFGANIVDTRDFTLGADPQRREENNVALVTEGAQYDVVYVADAHGELARAVPYATNSPRPVVGAAGLVADAWHWSWERHGAPQLNARFEEAADRRMGRFDWAAWTAVRALTQSVMRADSTDPAAVRDYLLGERMNLDGSKGQPMSVRPWDHQLRQGMLLTAGNITADLAPMEGFLHQTNDLDTLGVDAPQSACRF